MSYKTNNTSSKRSCERYYKHNSTVHSCKIDKLRTVPIKKVLPSRKLEPTSSGEVKSCSTGVLTSAKKVPISKSQKTTKSDMRFDSKRSVIDFCTKCGDSKTQKSSSCRSYNSNIDNRCNEIETQVFIDQQKSQKNVSEKKKLLHQYYKNENFTPSVKKNQMKNILDPIKEGIEYLETSQTSSESISEVDDDSVEEIGFLDTENDKTIKDIKNFRENNYFECHSAKARISSKGSVTSLSNHQCMYRFYLNDRLFPIPLNDDHQKIIRCTECHLPLDSVSNSDNTLNGTIQTKVKIGNEIQDLILILPVKKPLIIQEKRTLQNCNNKDVLYFGIVKLDYNGDSTFHSNLPNDSLALRYQKGYKEFFDNKSYKYEKVQKDDIIII